MSTPDVGGMVTAYVGGLLAGKAWFLLAALILFALLAAARSGVLDRPGRAVRDFLAQTWREGGRGRRVAVVTAWAALLALVVAVDMVHVPTAAEAQAQAQGQARAQAQAEMNRPLPSEVAGVITADGAPTVAPTGPGAAGAGKATPAPVAPVPVASGRLLHVFGGECLSASNPDYRGNGRPVVEARWRHCLPVMSANAQSEKPNPGPRNLIVFTNGMPLDVQNPAPLTAAQLATLNPTDRATVRKFDAAMAAWSADVALLDKANRAAMDAFGGYWSP